VIRERDGVIIIGDDVEIGPVAVTHRNLTIQAGGQTPINQFVPIDTSADSSTTKLQALVNALNAVKVPTPDIIDIIKGLERSGDLYGRVIIE
jgi:flagellar P-ring protein precursor FlgI